MAIDTGMLISNVQCDASLTSGTSRVARGGGFHGVAALLRVGYRSTVPPAERHADVGLRCARTP